MDIIRFSFIFTNMVIFSHMLSEVVFPAKAVRPSILLAVLAWISAGVILVLLFVSFEAIGKRKYPVAIVVAAPQEVMSIFGPMGV